MTDLPSPEDFCERFRSRLERGLTPEAKEWLERVLDLREEAIQRGDSRPPSFIQIAGELSKHLGTPINRHDVEGFYVRRRAAAAESCGVRR